MKRVISCLALAISVTMAHAQVAPRSPASSQITGVSGNGNSLATTSGSLTNGNCTSHDANGNLIDSGGPCGGPSVIAGQAIAPSSVDAATVYASTASGSDMGAKINTAAASCSGGNSCVVKIPAGFYTYSTAIVAGQSVAVEGEGPESSWLQYTGTGAAVTLSGAWSQIKNVVLQCTVACTYLVNMTGGSNVADNLLVEGGTSASTFFGIHGPNNRISNIVGANIAGTLYECDNAVNNFITNSQTFGVSGNTTSIEVDMNSGCNNLQIVGFQHSYSGLHGLIMRNTLTGGTPTGLFFSNFVEDQSAGGSMWVFDSTLGAAADNFIHIVNGFVGSAGQTGTTITTAAAIGIDIEGGRNLSFDNINVIDSAATGVLIGNAQVANIKFTNSFINNNNRNNTASTNGLTVSAAMSGLQLSGNTIGNLTGDNTGHQTYGVAVASSGVTNFTMSNSDLNGNVTGPWLNSMTAGNYTLSNNLPLATIPNTATLMSTSGVGNFAPFGYVTDGSGMTPGTSTTASCFEFMTPFTLVPAAANVYSFTADGTNYTAVALYDQNGNRISGSTSVGQHLGTSTAVALAVSGTPIVNPGAAFICASTAGTGTLSTVWNFGPFQRMASSQSGRAFTISGVSWSTSTATWPSTLGTRTNLAAGATGNGPFTVVFTP